jgi:hypothetical protein
MNILATSSWSSRVPMSKALTASDEERRQRGANGRHLVERQYSWPSIVSELLSACTAYC